MTELELRQAASSAAERTGAERIEFVQNSYPAAYWADILQLAHSLKDDMCIYNGYGRDII